MSYLKSGEIPVVCWQAAGAAVLVLKKQLHFHMKEFGVGQKPIIL